MCGCVHIHIHRMLLSHGTCNLEYSESNGCFPASPHSLSPQKGGGELPESLPVTLKVVVLYGIPKAAMNCQHGFFFQFISDYKVRFEKWHPPGTALSLLSTLTNKDNCTQPWEVNLQNHLIYQENKVCNEGGTKSRHGEADTISTQRERPYVCFPPVAVRALKATLSEL